MAAPVGAVWMVDEKRYRTAEEQTEGMMPEGAWLVGYSASVLPARAIPGDVSVPLANETTLAPMAGACEKGCHQAPQ